MTLHGLLKEIREQGRIELGHAQRTHQQPVLDDKVGVDAKPPRYREVTAIGVNDRLWGASGATGVDYKGMTLPGVVAIIEAEDLLLMR